MISAGNGVCEHFDCSNRTDRGYCRTTVCIHPHYSQINEPTTSNSYVNVEWNSYFHAYIRTRPIEDAVCVVRCRDCKHRITVGERELCERWNSSDMLSASNDFFCAYGERIK